MQQPRAHTQVRPYAVKENGDSVNVVSIALTAHLPMSFRPGAPVVGTRGEISLEVNFGFLTGRFLDYSLREFG